MESLSILCKSITCLDQTAPMHFQTFWYLVVIIIGTLFLSAGWTKLARGLFALSIMYGVAVLAISFGPETLLGRYGFEHFFSLRLTTFVAHTSAALASLFLFFATSKKRFAHDSFLYVASGVGIIALNLFVWLGRGVITSGYKIENLPGDKPYMIVLGMIMGTCVLMHARKIAISRGLQIRKSLFPLGVFVVSLLAMSLMSFKLQRDEMELLRNTQNLFMSGFQIALKEAVDNEVIPLNLLLSVKSADHSEAGSRETVLRIARGIIESRSVMQSIFWIMPNKKLYWSVKRDSVDDGVSPEAIKLIKNLDFYPALTELAEVAVVVPEEISKDSRVEIVVPYQQYGRVNAIVVAQLNFKKLLERAFAQIRFTKFNYALFSDSGQMTAANFTHVDYPGFAQTRIFDVFGKRFTVISHPSLVGLSQFLTFLPKFTILFGFLGALIIAHLMYVYSNLLVSYDQVEGMVRERTKELEIARVTAEDASKTKSLFLANISHEIRTPLNIIAGVSELLTETKLSPQQEHYVSMFRQACQNLLRLVNDLIDMSKIESGRVELEKTNFNLRHFVDELRMLYQIKASEKGIQLVTVLDNITQAHYQGDQLRIRQVLGNILMNAIKFTDTGAVTLSVSTLPTGVVFRISDTGKGIAKDKLEAIFERFEQIDKSVTRNKGGAGLGLAIAKDLVVLMGGEIKVESDVGLGTTFTVMLPLEAVEESVLEATVKESKGKTVSLPKGLRVLLTDDNADNRELVKVYLKNFDIEIDEAENGQVAVDRFKSKTFDLVLMDMQMPVLDGYSAAKQIRKYEAEGGTPSRRTPIVALTAHALRSDNVKCLDAGCDAYIAKPVSKNQLVEKMASFV